MNMPQKRTYSPCQSCEQAKSEIRNEMKSPKIQIIKANLDLVTVSGSFSSIANIVALLTEKKILKNQSS